MAGDDLTVPTAPALVTIRGVELVAAGEWALSTGNATFTPEDLAAAVEAAQCPAVGQPVIKIGHTDTRFNTGDGQPALGRVANMELTSGNSKIIGDLQGVPFWLGQIAASAYPQRSIEGVYDFVCQIGHTHPFVLTGLALLGATGPGVGVLNDLQDIAALYGVSASAGGPGGHVAGDGGVILAAGVTTEDVRRAYYEAASYNLWITEMQLAPDPQLIVCDDGTSKVFRVPVLIDGSTVTFGTPVEVEVVYEDLSVAASGAPAGRQRLAFASRAESREGVAVASDPEPPASDPPADPARGGGQVDAAGKHGTFTGTHAHSHAAMGAQGDDAMHEHEHTHDGDAVHGHEHAPAASSPPAPAAAALAASGTTKGSAVDFTDEQTAAIRARLGLKEGDELTPDLVTAAFADAGVAATGPGTVVIDQQVWDDMNARIQRGEQAFAAQRRGQRDEAIAAAISAGKFPVSRKESWERMWDSNPDSTREILAGLQRGVVPTSDIGSAGGLEPGGDADYNVLFAGA